MLKFIGSSGLRRSAFSKCAVASSARALEERPHAHWVHRNLAPALYGAGRTTEALASRDAMVTAYPELTVRKYKEVMVFSERVLGRISEQLRALGIPSGEE